MIKTTLKLISLLLIFSLSMVSCNDEHEDTSVAAILIGTWRTSSENSYTTITLKDNNTGTYTDCYIEGYNEYRFSGTFNYTFNEETGILEVVYTGGTYIGTRIKLFVTLIDNNTAWIYGINNYNEPIEFKRL